MYILYLRNIYHVILLLLCFRSLLEILVTILCFLGLSRLLVRLIVIRLGFRIGFVLVRFLLLFFVLKAGGGLAGIDAGLAQNLPGVYDDLFSKYSPGTLLSFWILVGFGTLGLPQTAVRSM